MSRGLDRRLAEPLLDDLRVLSLGDEKRCVRVAEVVERARITDRCSHCRQPDPASEVRAPDGTTRWRPEDQTRFVGVSREVSRRLLDNEGWHRHGAAKSIRLGRLDEELSFHFGEALLHPQRPPQGIEPFSAKGRKLPEPKPRVGSR